MEWMKSYKPKVLDTIYTANRRKYICIHYCFQNGRKIVGIGHDIHAKHNIPNMHKVTGKRS